MGGLFDAPIDTTFALYRPGKLQKKTEVFFSAIRTGGNYVARHLGWYISVNGMTSEQSDYYLNTNNGSTSLDKEYMKRIRYGVISKLIENTNLNFYELIHIISMPLYIKKTSFCTILKSSIYLFCKKLLFLLHIKK